MKRSALPAAALLLTLADCSHGGGVLPAAGGNASGTSQSAAISFVIKIPKRQHRRDHYISVSTQSILVKVYDATHTTLLSKTVRDLANSSAGCAAYSSATKCSFSVSAKPGHDTVDVTTFDQLGGTGHALSAMVKYPFAVKTGKKNSISLTLGGLATSFEVVATNTVQANVSGSTISVYGSKPQQLTILPLDADGAAIVGPGAVKPVIDATPSATALAVSGPNAWTLTSTYAATNPTIAGNATLAITATPVPGSGATTLRKSYSLKLYDPWIYVVDVSARLVYAFNEAGNSKSIYTGQGINGANAATYVPTTNWIYVSNNVTNSRMIVLDALGHAQTPSASTPFPNLNVPYASAFDSHNGQIYVTNYGNSTITAYDTQGNQVTTPSPHFNFSSFLNAPDAIAYDSHNGFLYIANTGNDTAAAYNESSVQETDQSSTFKNLNHPSGIAFDPNNNLIYIANEGAGITVYNEGGTQQTLPNGSFANTNQPGGIVYDPYDGLLYVTNYGNATITAYDEQGVQKALGGGGGSFTGLTQPWGIFLIP